MVGAVKGIGCLVADEWIMDVAQLDDSAGGIGGVFS